MNDDIIAAIVDHNPCSDQLCRMPTINNLFKIMFDCDVCYANGRALVRHPDFRAEGEPQRSLERQETLGSQVDTD